MSVALMGCSTALERAYPPSGLETLWVEDPERLSPAEQTLVVTPQGLVAEGASAIWVEDSGMNALILEDLLAEGVTLQRAGSIWDLLSQFRNAVAGMVIYDLETDSINVAVSLWGPLRAVAVDGPLQIEAEAAGLEVLADVRGMDEAEALAAYGDLFIPAEGADAQLAVLIGPAESKNAHLRDFCRRRGHSPSMVWIGTPMRESPPRWDEI